MPSLGNKNDVQSTQNASQKSSIQNIKCDKSVNFISIVDDKYGDGFLHFMKVGRKFRVLPCKSGRDGHGFDPENCPICKDVLDMYNQAKELKKAGNDAEAEAIKKKANDLRANYSLKMHAIQGEAFLAKNKKTGQKEYEPDFDDVNSTGVINFSEPQKNLLLSILDDEEYDDLNDGDDLVGVILRVEREKTGNKKWSKIIPDNDLDLKKMGLNLKDLPDLEKSFDVPDDFDEKYEEYKTSPTVEEDDNGSDTDGEYEVTDTKKQKSGSKRPRRNRK